MAINTTPLIDVMLVLLIMFIITIPIQSHAVKLDLPQDNPNNTPPPTDPVQHKIVVTRARQSGAGPPAGQSEQPAAPDRSGEEQDRRHSGWPDPLERQRGRSDPASPV